MPRGAQAATAIQLPPRTFARPEVTAMTGCFTLKTCRSNDSF